MKKISTNNTDKKLILYIIKIFVSTVLTVLIFSIVISKIMLSLDIDIENAKLFSVLICIVSAMFISFVSTIGFKNNGILLGVISVIPLMLYSVINTFVNSNNIGLLIIKLLIIIIIGALLGWINVKRKRTIKVK